MRQWIKKEPITRIKIGMKIGISFVMIIFMLSLAPIVLAKEVVPVKGMVTLVDLGAKKCIPCKMMAPILKKLKTAYEGKAAIVFIDVWENREPAGRFKIRAIPTQIFFDEQGKEVSRHEGFLDEDAIVEQLTRMGVDKPVSLNPSPNQGS